MGIFSVMKPFYTALSWWIRDPLHLSKPLVRHQKSILKYANKKNQPECQGIFRWNTDYDKLF